MGNKYRARAMRTLTFHGGTSLRFFYDIPRYSENLGFALELHLEAYDFQAYLARISRDFSAESCAVDIKLNEERVVHKAFVRFRGFLLRTWFIRACDRNAVYQN